MKTKFVLPLIALLVPSHVVAETNPLELDTEISVVGDAPSAAAPDYVTITAKLDSTAASATETITQLDTRMSRLVESLRSICPALQSRTRADIFPSQTPAGLGLRAGTAVRIVRTVALDCPSVDKTGKLVDSALGQSGVEIADVTFSVRDNTKPLSDAVKAAAQRAQEKATLVASTLGVKLGPIVSSIVTEEPEGAVLREQLKRGEPALEYGDKVQHVYVTLRYRIAR